MSAMSAQDRTPPVDLRLTAYVVAGNRLSATLVADLRRALDATLGREGWQLEIVDVVREPARAVENGITATPTLVREAPAPRVHVLWHREVANGVLGVLGIA